VWLDKALTRKYITKELYDELNAEVARLLNFMENNAGHYANKNN